MAPPQLILDDGRESGRVILGHPSALSAGRQLQLYPAAPSAIAFSNLLTRFPAAATSRLPGLGAVGEQPSAPLPLLPYQQLVLPPMSEETAVLPPDMFLTLHSCGLKIVQGTVIGSILGVGMGLFLGAVGSGESSALSVIQGREVPAPPAKEALRSGLKSLMTRSRGMALNFAVLTALFEGSECVVERYRGKHDVWNNVASGCFSGAAMSAKAGPGPACLACVGFASFSLIINQVMGPH